MFDIDNADLGMMTILGAIVACLSAIYLGAPPEPVINLGSVAVAALAGIARGKSNGNGGGG